MKGSDLPVKIPLISITVVALILIIAAFITGGLPLAIQGLNNSVDAFLRTIPLLVPAFVIIGQLKLLLNANLVNRFLQKYSGVKGVMACAFGGGLLSGDVYIIYSFIGSIFQKVIPFHLLLSVVVGKRIYNFSRLPVEMGLINPLVALIRYLITLPVPILMGLLAYRLFPQDTISTPYVKEGETGAAIDNSN